MEMTAILQRWAEYTEDLYKKDENMPEPECYQWEEDKPDLLKEEARKALQEIANEKAPGHDNINVGMWKYLTEDGLDMLHQLCQLSWKTAKWPRDWK